MATPNPYTSDLSQLSRFLTLPKSGSDDVHGRNPQLNHLQDAILEQLRSKASQAAASWKLSAIKRRLPILETRWKNADQAIRAICRCLRDRAQLERNGVEDFLRFFDNRTLLLTALQEAHDGIRTAQKLPQVEIDGAERMPRAYAAGESFLRTVNYNVTNDTLVTFMKGAQECLSFRMSELWTLKSMMQLALVERIGEIAGAYRTEQDLRAHLPATAIKTGHVNLSTLLVCLRRLEDLDWEQVFDEVNVTERILRSDDPLGAYSQMDLESRELYRNALLDMAAHSRCSEENIARAAVDLARGPHTAPTERARERRSHVGYYLVDDGASALKKAIGYQPSVAKRFQEIILNWPNAFYFSGIGLGTLAVMALFIAIPGVKSLRPFELALFLIPAVECAVAMMNQFAALVVPPRKLSKLAFSNGIPLESTTMVAIPMLLGSEEQVKQAAKDLEVRYLANRDAHLHFVLLTDPPDSVQQFDEKDNLAELCSKLIVDLNEKYAAEGKGSFYHLHRNRSYNSSEGIWMAWERKRGKLLDFNNLLLGKSDNFSIRVGDLSLLPKVHYVITLDQDTQLPKDSAHNLIGALAHPLNRAVIDPVTNTVVEGYGVLQPRVETSIKSKGLSRLAGIYSGDAGFDIYSRAISDVYQDLFGEGIFTGKGIYEVRTFQQVLDQRFPCNTVLSHDLIEGAYTRAGLLTDVEVIDDYPSHVSAYSRRKHRWVRGDWQIIWWLLSRVPDHSGKLVHNPLTLISRWKIVDNLRRSLTEFALFMLLLCGWTVLPGNPLFWTLATLAIISLPTYCQFVVSLVRAVSAGSFSASWRNMLSDFSSMQAILLFRLALLCHQSLVTLDAVGRTVIRMTVTRKRLLQWETAAEAESADNKKGPIEAYLNWTPWICFAMDAVIVLVRPSAIFIALPFLALWGSSKTICEWLNLPYWTGDKKFSEKDRATLRGSALRTWRFFREFSNAEENWLIPDVIHEDRSIVAHQISPTNLGFVFNSRLAAYDLGWSSLTEFVAETERTFDTVAQMPKYHGHFYNWYNTITLQPIGPRFVSTVDEGNLVCCLWTLKQACAQATKEPLFRKALWQGISDHLEMILEHLPQDGSNEKLLARIQGLRVKVKALGRSAGNWLDVLPGLAPEIVALEKQLFATALGEDVKWWAHELSARITNLQSMLYDFMPWLLPQFARYRDHFAFGDDFKPERLTLESRKLFQSSVENKVQEIMADREMNQPTRSDMAILLSLLSRSATLTQSVTARLLALANTADATAKNIDFTLLYNQDKKLLSIGYDAENNSIHGANYDLLASEARAASFVAIAKGEIPQANWLRLGRQRKTYENSGVLISWTGTMFEYLLPALWMKSYPNTVLEQTSQTVVRVQKNFAAAKSIPWGISESSCSERNPDNHYRYHAFGMHCLAVHRSEGDDLVISPYSTFLSLLVDADSSIANIREMKAKGWLGVYGFFEALDFTPSRMSEGQECEIVRCWMAHHQGMSLVAAATVLCDLSMQRRFHAEPMVAATERLLQEKVSRMPAPDLDLDESIVEFPAVPSNAPQPAWIAAD